MKKIILIAHNLRSTHNVGSLLRTAEGLGVEKVIFSGYTPYPLSNQDTRLPHIAAKLDKQIAKTALGAEKIVKWQYHNNINEILNSVRADRYKIIALEQAVDSVKLPQYETAEKSALVIGRETEGIEPEVLQQCDEIIEIPMQGHKESFNVVQAAAMALYHMTYVR